MRTAQSDPCWSSSSSRSRRTVPRSRSSRGRATGGRPLTSCIVYGSSAQPPPRLALTLTLALTLALTRL